MIDGNNKSVNNQCINSKAVEFLRLLDPNATTYNFRTFDDVRGRGDLSLAKKIRGTLDSCCEQLGELNERGAGVFVVVNDGGNTDAEISRVRAVFADTDGALLEPLLVLEPHIIVQSSNGNWHLYWLVDEHFGLNMFKPIQKAIAVRYGTDPVVHNLSRVMRLPGFNHCKSMPYSVQLLKVNPELPRYSANEVIIGLSLDVGSATVVLPEISSSYGLGLANGTFSFDDKNKRLISQALEHRTNSAGWNRFDKFSETLFALRSLVLDAGWPNERVWKVFDAWALKVDSEEGRYDHDKNLKMWSAKDRSTGSRITYRSLLWSPELQPPKKISEDSGGITAEELSRKHFNPLMWVVQDILPEGCYLLSARPKVGKSWLALQLSLAVAKGTNLWGKSVAHGKAIYLALEENQRRLKTRLGQLDLNWSTSNLILYTDFKRMEKGCLEDLERLIKTHAPKLLVIDTLAKIRPPSVRGANAYEADYKAVAPLTALANKYRCCILIVTHNRKGRSEDDALEQVSGTLGLSGACDGALIIEGPRNAETAKLTLIGRDIEQDGEFAIKHLPTGGWDWLGKADAVFVSQERQQIIDSIRIGGPMTPNEISKCLGKKANSVRQLLYMMVANGQIKHDGKKYFLHT